MGLRQEINTRRHRQADANRHRNSLPGGRTPDAIYQEYPEINSINIGGLPPITSWTAGLLLNRFLTAVRSLRHRCHPKQPDSDKLPDNFRFSPRTIRAGQRGSKRETAFPSLTLTNLFSAVRVLPGQGYLPLKEDDGIFIQPEEVEIFGCLNAGPFETLSGEEIRACLFFDKTSWDRDSFIAQNCQF